MLLSVTDDVRAIVLSLLHVLVVRLDTKLLLLLLLMVLHLLDLLQRLFLLLLQDLLATLPAIVRLSKLELLKTKVQPCNLSCQLVLLSSLVMVRKQLLGSL